MSQTEAKFIVKVAPNKMRALADFIQAPQDSTAMSAEDAIEHLREMNITVGIKEDNIIKMCQSDHPLVNVLVAEGVRPKIGENARIEMLIDVNTDRSARLRPDGSVDFYDLGEISSAKAGQELYRKIPPTQGEPGYNVYGEEIPGLWGRDITLQAGRGTKIDEEDPNLVRAEVEGEVITRKNRVEISSIHTVEGDVDFSTGNIKFTGSIRITGTVKAGFDVTGDGNIEIKGNVEDATVIAGNDVVIHGGFVGTGEGVVRAKQDVFVKFVENQRIEAERDIIINGQSYHAILRSGRSIKATGPKGIIVGGTCEAKDSVEALNFGSIAATPTIINIGIDPAVMEQMMSLDREIAAAEESLEKVQKSIVFLYRQKIDNKNTLPPDKEELLKKLEGTKKTLPEKIESLKADLESLTQTREEIAKAFALASNKVFPKVQVFVGRQWLTVTDTLGPSRFKLIGSEVARLSV